MMDVTNIGLPEKKHWQIDLPEEEWPVPTVIPVPEEEPVEEPVPA